MGDGAEARTMWLTFAGSTTGVRVESRPTIVHQRLGGFDDNAGRWRRTRRQRALWIFAD